MRRLETSLREARCDYFWCALQFLFPESFWDSLFGESKQKRRVVVKSDAYFGLIRNYYRFGWLIPYFFGASPALCSSFIKGREITELTFGKGWRDTGLPATALRLSDSVTLTAHKAFEDRL
ncbi:hypothetical protein OH492_04225 [Vibrio chagasii]|nr:hypothetical protein [Vibrio chagasii]